MPVIEITAVYSLASDTHAWVSLESRQPAGGTLSIIHECITGITHAYDSTGEDLRLLDVVTSESVTLIARREGRIIGALVNEVDCREESRLVLLPRGGYNLIVYQQRNEDYHELLERHTHQERIRVLTPMTMQLAQLLGAAHARYAAAKQPLPTALRQITQAINEAIAINDERHSRQMIVPLQTVLEEEMHLERAPSAELVLSATLQTRR